MKLIPERQKMIDTVLAGFGELGNDLFGKHLAGYSASIPQHDQDIEQAKSLLKSAGQSNLTVTLQTTDALPGLTDAATFYAQEAKKAGVTVNVKTVPGSSYFNPSLLFLKMPFAQDSWPIVSLSHAYHLLGTSTAPVNEGHWTNPTFDAQVQAAESTLNAGEVEGLVDAGAADVLAGLELHRLGPPPLDERHRAEPERRGARLALPARGHEGLELVVVVALLRGRGHRAAAPQVAIHLMSFAGEATAGPEEIQVTTAHRKRLPLLRFFLRRLAIGALTLLAASMLIFAATDLLPGQPGLERTRQVRDARGDPRAEPEARLRPPARPSATGTGSPAPCRATSATPPSAPPTRACRRRSGR